MGWEKMDAADGLGENVFARGGLPGTRIDRSTTYHRG